MSRLTDSTKQKIRQLLQNKAILSPWEISLLQNCLKFSNRLTDKQITRTQQIIAKHHRTTPPTREPSPLKRTDTTKTKFNRDEIIKGKALRYYPLKKER